MYQKTTPIFLLLAASLLTSFADAQFVFEFLDETTGNAVATVAFSENPIFTPAGEDQFVSFTLSDEANTLFGFDGTEVIDWEIPFSKFQSTFDGNLTGEAGSLAQWFDFSPPASSLYPNAVQLQGIAVTIDNSDSFFLVELDSEFNPVPLAGYSGNWVAVNPVPEPSTIAVAALGLGILHIRRRR